MLADQDVQTMSHRFMEVATAHICDALEHVGIRTPTLPDTFHPVTQQTKFAGRAVTLRLAFSRTGSEPRRLNELVEDAARPGSVVVIDALGKTASTLFGDRAAFTAKRSGAVGAVVNGGCRDIDGLNELGFPVHAIGRSLPASEGKYQGLEINGDVVFEGVLISAGDWIVADESGICVVPQQLADRVLVLAEEREQIDRESMAELRAGKTLREVHRHFKDDDVGMIGKTE
jgi:4-hydroxy-4-methyl-2-oxoglutarate aldolase